MALTFTLDLTCTEALQRYTLIAAQQSTGGLRDKPTAWVPFDFPSLFLYIFNLTMASPLAAPQMRIIRCTTWLAFPQLSIVSSFQKSGRKS